MQAAEGGAAAAGKTAEAGRNGLSIKKEPFRNVGGGGTARFGAAAIPKGEKRAENIFCALFAFGQKFVYFAKCLDSCQFLVYSVCKRTGR